MARVLIVDDKEENFYYLQSLLAGHGWVADTARHGAEALVKARLNQPDLVISDLLMPVMDGYTLLRHWKADPRLYAVPFIVYTATYTDVEDEQLARDLGADAFILKPVEPEIFLRHVQEVQARVGAVARARPGALTSDDDVLLKNYSEVLIRKLEEKTLQLEDTNRALARDIAMRQQMEESVKLAGLIYASSAEAVVVTDEANRIVDVNPAFTAQTGYALAEVRGSDPRLLKSGDHAPSFYQEMWQAIRTHGYWRGELRNHRKDGSTHIVLANISVIRHPDGRIYRHVGQFFDVTDMRRKEDLIWKQANLDKLTELPNRSLLQERLTQAVAVADLGGLPCALLFVDLDRFKEVNEVFGHSKGDALLVEAAWRISRCVREADTVARFGGDEFIILLPEVRARTEVDRIVRDILRSLARPFELGSSQVNHISASAGIAFYPDDAGSAEDWLKQAEQAMYSAKAAGRGRFCYFTRAMQEAAQERLALTHDLRSALARDELEVYYQPIVDLATGTITKAEALLRWKHPVRGMIGPATFIPLAEETGLIGEIGDWVFRQAVGCVLRWRKKFKRIIQVSVNTSPVQFELVDHQSWVELLQAAGLPDRSIAIEITEGLLIKDSAKVRQRLLEYKKGGIEVSIDDFGTGFSGLAYLKQFDVDYLKIDRVFVSNLTEDQSDRALTEAIVVMGRKLGIKTIAEGVETQAQRDLLCAFGCDYVQGYLYSPPVAVAAFEKLLTR